MNQLSVLKITSDKVDHIIETLGLELKPSEKNKCAVFFDIDGTINRNDCLELLVNEVIQRGLLTSDKTVLFQKARRLWKTKESDFDEYQKVVIEMQKCLKHFSREILEKLAFDIFEREGYYYLFPWLLLLKLKISGYQLIAVSGAPSFMATAYMKKIGFFPEEIHATDFIFEGDTFTGDVDSAVWKDKGEFILKTYGKTFDLKKCIGLGDTMSDAKMFKKLGHPISINPSLDLAEESKKYGWPIVIERKNLVVVLKDGKVLEV